MRVMLLLVALTCLQTVYAQDYCKRIKKEVSEDKTAFDYTSPYDQNEKPSLTVKRSYNINSDEPFDNFILQFRIVGPLDDIYTKTADGNQVEKEEKILTVEFDDKTKFIDDTIQVDHDISDDRIFAIRYLNFPLSDETLKDFTSKKIVKFTLAGYSQTVTIDSATSIQHYIQCMKAVK